MISETERGARLPIPAERSRILEQARSILDRGRALLGTLDRNDGRLPLALSAHRTQPDSPVQPQQLTGP